MIKDAIQALIAGETLSRDTAFQAIMDIKNDLQRVMEKIDRLIVNGD